MQRRGFLILTGAAGAIALAAPALAADPTEAVIAQLRAEGYRDLREHRTLLGRIRINARRGNQLREVVVDPRNGEILRDLTRTVVSNSGSSSRSGSSGSGSSGSGSSGSGGSGSDDSGSDDSGSDDSGSDHGDSGGGSDSGSDDGGNDD